MSLCCYYQGEKGKKKKQNKDNKWQKKKDIIILLWFSLPSMVFTLENVFLEQFRTMELRLYSHSRSLQHLLGSPPYRDLQRISKELAVISSKLIQIHCNHYSLEIISQESQIKSKKANFLEEVTQLLQYWQVYCSFRQHGSLPHQYPRVTAPIKNMNHSRYCRSLLSFTFGLTEN